MTAVAFSDADAARMLRIQALDAAESTKIWSSVMSSASVFASRRLIAALKERAMSKGLSLILLKRFAASPAPASPEATAAFSIHSVMVQPVLISRLASGSARRLSHTVSQAMMSEGASAVS